MNAGLFLGRKMTEEEKKRFRANFAVGVLLFALFMVYLMLEIFLMKSFKGKAPDLFGFTPKDKYKEEVHAEYYSADNFLYGKEPKSGKYAELAVEEYNIRTFAWHVHLDKKIIAKQSYYKDKLAEVIVLCHETNVRQFISSDWFEVGNSDEDIIILRSVSVRDRRYMSIARIHNLGFFMDIVSEFPQTEEAKKWLRDLKYPTDWVYVSYFDGKLLDKYEEQENKINAEVLFWDK